MHKLRCSQASQMKGHRANCLSCLQSRAVLFTEYKDRHWQRRALRAWQLKEEERENMMCNESGTCKIIMAGHIILTLLGIVSTLMIFQHVTLLNHDDTGAGSTYQIQSEKVML